MISDETRRAYELVVEYMTTPGPWNGGNNVPDEHYEIAGRAMLRASEEIGKKGLSRVKRRAIHILRERLRLGVEL